MSNAKGLKARAKARASKAFAGQEGSALWCIRVAFEWLHEFVKAVNSALTLNQAQKELEHEAEKYAVDAKSSTVDVKPEQIDEDRLRKINVYSRAQADTRTVSKG